MKNVLNTLALVLLAFASQLALAESDRGAEVGERLAQARDRLDLSDEQLDQIAPVMEESLAKRNSIMSRYGVDPQNPERSKRPNFRQARAMRSEMEAVRSDTLASLEGILSREQLDEFKSMQEEQRAEMRERMRAAR